MCHRKKKKDDTMFSSRVFKYVSYLSCLLIVLTLSGCIKYYKVLKNEFPQGEDFSPEEDVMRRYVRNTAVYDQFQTLAHFDAMWLSDEMKTTYVGLHGARIGRDEEGRETLLRRQLEENKHWISFYILADIREKNHTSLSEKNASWTFYLELSDGERVQPVSIKEVEIEPEYQYLFGHRFNNHKSSYLIKFPAHDLTGEPYLDQGPVMKLGCCSASKKTTMAWKMLEKPEKKIKKESLHEDFYWG